VATVPAPDRGNGTGTTRRKASGCSPNKVVASVLSVAKG
ncbi:hypothetical protein A2U01_0098146, partial [Trifolium medium]|nr:hypothetical protein [Trifolium medium]